MLEGLWLAAGGVCGCGHEFPALPVPSRPLPPLRDLPLFFYFFFPPPLFIMCSKLRPAEAVLHFGCGCWCLGCGMDGLLKLFMASTQQVWCLALGQFLQKMGDGVPAPCMSLSYCFSFNCFLSWTETCNTFNIVCKQEQKKNSKKLWKKQN